MEDNQSREVPVEETVVEETVADAAEQPTPEPEVAAEEATVEEQMTEEKPSGKDKKKAKKAEAEIAKLQKELSEHEAKIAEMNDQYLRVCAEYDNFRKRTAKEREGVYADAYIDALTQILPILDNLDRAAAFSTEDPENPLAQGLDLTRKSFVDTLEKMGVTEIEALGKPFDPNLHNAVMHVEDENAGESEIVEVFMKGYIRGEKVLRYSMVKVAN